MTKSVILFTDQKATVSVHLKVNESILSIKKVTLRFRGVSGYLVPKM